MPALARCLLGLGTFATLAANVAHGLGHGIIGAVVAVWSAVALVGLLPGRGEVRQGQRRRGPRRRPTRHISTWPSLRPAQQPVTHAALVVSHQCRRPPRERSSQVYTRPEFVSALPFPVISARQLFDWWRAADWPAVRNAIVSSGRRTRQTVRLLPARICGAVLTESPSAADCCGGGEAGGSAPFIRRL